MTTLSPAEKSACWDPGCTVSKCPHIFHSTRLDCQNVCTGKFLKFTEKNENQFVIYPINFYKIKPYSESYYILSEGCWLREQILYNLGVPIQHYQISQRGKSNNMTLRKHLKLEKVV